MTNLREEIEHIIKINIMSECMSDEQMAKPFSYLVTEKIMDEIEKRLDEHIKTNYSKLNQQGSTYLIMAILEQEIILLTQLKKEMLKQ